MESCGPPGIEFETNEVKSLANIKGHECQCDAQSFPSGRTGSCQN